MGCSLVSCFLPEFSLQTYLRYNLIMIFLFEKMPANKFHLFGLLIIRFPPRKENAIHFNPFKSFNLDKEYFVMIHILSGVSLQQHENENPVRCRHQARNDERQRPIGVNEISWID